MKSEPLQQLPSAFWDICFSKWDLPPFLLPNSQLSLLDTSNFSGLKYLSSVSWLFSYIFDFHRLEKTGCCVHGPLLSGHSLPYSTHCLANSLSWIHSALSRFRSPIFLTEMFSRLTWETLFFSRYKRLLLQEAFLPSSHRDQCPQDVGQLLSCCH